MDDMTKDIESALKADFPNAKLAHRPLPNGKPLMDPPTLTAEIDQMIAGLQARISFLEQLRRTL